MEILVIILSAFLALFLLIGIVLAILLIRITQQIKRVTMSAERTVSGLETVVATAGKVTTPAMIAKLVLGQLNKRRKK
ncbi:MAG: hypothetical protein V4678_00420 [Patescibacteria group bacterium]